MGSTSNQGSAIRLVWLSDKRAQHQDSEIRLVSGWQQGRCPCWALAPDKRYCWGLVQDKRTHFIILLKTRLTSSWDWAYIEYKWSWVQTHLSFGDVGPFVLNISCNSTQVYPINHTFFSIDISNVTSFLIYGKFEFVLNLLILLSRPKIWDKFEKITIGKLCYKCTSPFT